MIELRTSDYSNIEAIAGLIEDADIGSEFRIGVGSEACVHKLPPAEVIAGISNIECIDGVTLVTPITPQKHFDYVLRYVSEVADLGIRNLRIVVNDLGILNSCEIDLPVAGRGIVHTSEACPWADHILRDESDYIQGAYLQTNLNYSRTSAILTGMGIRGIETDLLPRTIVAAKRLDMPVYAHFGYAVVAYARSCHTARFYSEKPPICAHLCNSPMELELRDIFDLESLSFAQPDADVKEVFPTLYLLGNTIYMKSEYCDAAGVDGVIVNVDMYERIGGVMGAVSEILRMF